MLRNLWSIIIPLLSSCLALMFPIFLATIPPKLKPMKMLNVSVDNFTSCQQFLNGTTLDMFSVIDVDWKIFYFWNHEDERSYNIRFSVANPSLVRRFQVELQDDIKPEVNWTAAEMFMETAIDFSALFIKTKMSGLYRIIPNIAFEVKTTPLMTFALKYVEPGYLGIMNCKYRLCYALAPVDKMPHSSDIEKAAASLGFLSDYGRSYLTAPPAPVLPIVTIREEDDAEDDVEHEIEMDQNKLTVF